MNNIIGQDKLTDEELEKIGVHYADNKNNKLLYFFSSDNGNSVVFDINKDDTLKDIIDSIRVQSYYDGVAFGKKLMARDTEIFFKEYLNNKDNMKRME